MEDPTNYTQIGIQELIFKLDRGQDSKETTITNSLIRLTPNFTLSSYQRSDHKHEVGQG